jgi:hypothetical protein
MRQVRVLLILLFLTSACASPAARYYKLSALATPTASATAVSVAVGPVTIPALVDRPQFIVSTGPNEVRVEEFQRWAAPLADDIGRVVAENLVVLLGTPRVALFPQQAAEAAQYRVVIGVQRFESEPGAAARLDALWSVRRTSDGVSQSGRTTVREATPTAGYEALAAAHSRALAQLSQDIANAIRALDARGERGKGAGSTEPST